MTSGSFGMGVLCEHRRSGREFCAANVYPDDEDDSTKESEGHKCKNENRMKRKSAQSDMVAALIETVNELLDSESSKTQEDTWLEQKHLLQEKQDAQKLVTLTAILERNVIRGSGLVRRYVNHPHH
ncbi:hypothetical protein DVH05_015057 [Phytophthora capsici]|nr:hypothetical protein DVH05_015055 [Phytophthora capsici]KAG1698519.1 hypothetical protein DVH05_015057 [Phytophthora capsici]